MNKEKNHYYWEGTNNNGDKIDGIMDASCIAVVKIELNKLGIHCKKISTKPRFFSRKIDQSEISLFCRQLATLLKVGIPLIQAFDIAVTQYAKSPLRPFIEMLKKDVQAGLSFSEALHKHPALFNELFCNLVRVGEKSGKIELILDQIATYKEKNARIKKRLANALAYPVIVLLIAFLVGLTLLTFVIPQFEILFNSFDADLPLLTKIVINLSSDIKQFGLIILILSGCVAYSLILAKKYSVKFVQILDETTLKIPILGAIIVKTISARFTRTLAITFAAGLTIIDALNTVESVTANQVYAKATAQIRNAIKLGESLQLAMKNTRLFPDMAIQMIAIGEESGELELMLLKIADFYEEEVSNSVDSLTKMFEPIIMTILGIIVGGLVIAMYLPIFKLGSVI